MKKTITLSIILSSICVSPILAEIVLLDDYPQNPPTELSPSTGKNFVDDVLFLKTKDITEDTSVDLYIKDPIVTRKSAEKEIDSLKSPKAEIDESDTKKAKMLEGFIDTNDGFSDSDSSIIKYNNKY